MLVWGSRGIRYTVTGTTWPKKLAAAPCSETAGAKKLKKFTETCFVTHYYACKFGLNWLRIDGDIRQKATITAILENVVIAIYRLRPIQLEWLFGTHLPGPKRNVLKLEWKSEEIMDGESGENETNELAWSKNSDELLYTPVRFVNLVAKPNSIDNGELQVHVTFLQLCTWVKNRCNTIQSLVKNLKHKCPFYDFSTTWRMYDYNAELNSSCSL